MNTTTKLMENGKDTLKHGFRETKQNILDIKLMSLGPISSSLDSDAEWEAK